MCIAMFGGCVAMRSSRVRWWIYVNVYLPYQEHRRSPLQVQSGPLVTSSGSKYHNSLFDNFCIYYDSMWARVWNNHECLISKFMDPDQTLYPHILTACDYQRSGNPTIYRLLHHLSPTNVTYVYDEVSRGPIVKTIAQPSGRDVTDYFTRIDGPDYDFGMMSRVSFDDIRRDLAHVAGFATEDIKSFDISTMEHTINVSLSDDVYDAHCALFNE